MAMDYAPLMSALDDDRLFPNGVCPIMSRMQIVMMPAPVGPVEVQGASLKVVQQETFLAAPCIKEHCALWIDGVCRKTLPGG
jgi:hypothetical protein